MDNCANIFAIQHTRQVQFPKALWLQQALDPSYMCIASSEIQLAWISFRGTWCSVLLLGCVQKIDFCETSRWVFHLGNNSVCSWRNTNSSFSDRFLLVWINHVHLTKIFDHWFENTVWTFWNFYASHILREISFGQFQFCNVSEFESFSGAESWQ